MALERDGVLVRRVIDEVCNRGALEVADDLFAADYVNHGGLIPDLVRGPEAIKVGVALYRVAFPAFAVVVDDLRAEGEMVVLRWTAHAGRPGAPGRVTGVTRVRLAGGRIAESWTSWDREGALERLGLRPPPAAA